MRIQDYRGTGYLYQPRTGYFKMNSSIFGEAVFGVIKLKVNSWFHTFPRKQNELRYEKNINTKRYHSKRRTFCARFGSYRREKIAEVL